MSDIQQALYTKEAIEHELPQFYKQLNWAIKNFYKDPMSDFALVWLDRTLFWWDQICDFKEQLSNAPSEY